MQGTPLQCYVMTLMLVTSAGVHSTWHAAGTGGVNKNTSFWEDSEADTRTVRVVHTTFRGLTMNTKQEMRQKPDGATGSSVDFCPPR